MKKMFRATMAIVVREAIRLGSQRSRLIASLVRPLLWLLVFAAGFRSVLGSSIIQPYETQITYEVYIIPGLCCMIQLFNGMQSSLSLVYDREMGSMRLLLTSPMPRWWLLISKLLAGALSSIVQVYAFLAIAALYGIVFPVSGYFLAFPVLLLNGLMLGSLGLLLSSTIKQLENFAGVMNFVIFPLFFMSTALYPLSKLAESSDLLGFISSWNPFTHAVELLRFSLYNGFNALAFFWVLGFLVALLAAGLYGYNPSKKSLA